MKGPLMGSTSPRWRDSSACSSRKRTLPNRCEERTFLKRMGCSDRWESPPSQINWCKKSSDSCCKPSMNHGFKTPPTGFDPIEVVIQHWLRLNQHAREQAG